MSTTAEKLIERVRKLCLAFPETREIEAWGHPTFRAGKKMFAAVGAPYGQAPTLGMKMSYDRQEELLQDSRFFPTPYAAHLGWVSIELNRRTDWSEIANLLREAYCQVALKRMLAALEKHC